MYKKWILLLFIQFIEPIRIIKIVGKKLRTFNEYIVFTIYIVYNVDV